MVWFLTSRWGETTLLPDVVSDKRDIMWPCVNSCGSLIEHWPEKFNVLVSFLWVFFLFFLMWLESSIRQTAGTYISLTCSWPCVSIKLTLLLLLFCFKQLILKKQYKLCNDYLCWSLSDCHCTHCTSCLAVCAHTHHCNDEESLTRASRPPISYLFLHDWLWHGGRIHLIYVAASTHDLE